MATAAVKQQQKQAAKRFLHVGCGPKETAPPLPKLLLSKEWQEIRLDIDERVKPDIVASMTDMINVETGSMDAIYSSHNIEHLMLHEVRKALAEFHRVLTPNGFVFLTCPDLQSIAARIATGDIFGTVYTSPAGPVNAFDMVFGFAPYVQHNSFMAHKSGFTLEALFELFAAAGFKMPLGNRNPEVYDMWVLAYKERQDVDSAKAQFQALMQF